MTSSFLLFILQAISTCKAEDIVLCGVEKANVQTNSFELAKLGFKAKHANFYITLVAHNKTDDTNLILQTLIWKRVLDNGRWQISLRFVRLVNLCKTTITDD